MTDRRLPPERGGTNGGGRSGRPPFPAGGVPRPRVSGGPYRVPLSPPWSIRAVRPVRPVMPRWPFAPASPGVVPGPRASAANPPDGPQPGGPGSGGPGPAGGYGPSGGTSSYGPYGDSRPAGEPGGDGPTGAARWAADNPPAEGAAGEAPIAPIGDPDLAAGDPVPADEVDGAVDEAVEAEAASELATLARERDDYRDALVRLQADFENYKKRILKQQTEHLERAAEGLVDKLLPVLDALDGALAHGGGEDVKQITGLFLSTLERDGLDRIDAPGVPFDPTVHEAVAHEPGDGGPQEVAEVFRAGYRWKGRLLRAAMVRVRG